MNDSMTPEQRSKLRAWIRDHFSEIEAWKDGLASEAYDESDPPAEARGRAAMDLGFPVTDYGFAFEWEVAERESERERGV